MLSEKPLTNGENPPQEANKAGKFIDLWNSFSAATRREMKSILMLEDEEFKKTVEEMRAIEGKSSRANFLANIRHYIKTDNPLAEGIKQQIEAEKERIGKKSVDVETEPKEKKEEGKEEDLKVPPPEGFTAMEIETPDGKQKKVFFKVLSEIFSWNVGKAEIKALSRERAVNLRFPTQEEAEQIVDLVKNNKDNKDYLEKAVGVFKDKPDGSMIYMSKIGDKSTKKILPESKSNDFEDTVILTVAIWDK